MSKLSNGGKLYLKDYEVLEEVRGEVNSFLDFLIDGLKEIFDREIENLSTDLFEMYVFSHQSKKGYFELAFRNKKTFESSKEGKVALRIIYRDIRHDNDINPNQGSISVDSPKLAADIKSKLSKISTKRNVIDIYESSTVDFDLDNGLETIRIIQENILEVYEELMGCVNELVSNESKY